MSDPNTKSTLLIVDDDPLITDTLAYALGKDFEVLVSDSRGHAVSLLRQLDHPPRPCTGRSRTAPGAAPPDEGFD